MGCRTELHTDDGFAGPMSMRLSDIFLWPDLFGGLRGNRAGGWSGPDEDENPGRCARARGEWRGEGRYGDERPVVSSPRHTYTYPPRELRREEL